LISQGTVGNFLASPYCTQIVLSVSWDFWFVWLDSHVTVALIVQVDSCRVCRDFAGRVAERRAEPRLGTSMNSRLDRNALEGLRDHKRSRNFFRLASTTTVQHEFRGQYGHPSSYAFVRFECAPADDLSFEVCASWSAAVDKGDLTRFERAIAESVADVLLDGLYQHTGYTVSLVEVRYDDIGSSEAEAVAHLTTVRDYWSPRPIFGYPG